MQLYVYSLWLPHLMCYTLITHSYLIQSSYIRLLKQAPRTVLRFKFNITKLDKHINKLLHLCLGFILQDSWNLTFVETKIKDLISAKRYPGCPFHPLGKDSMWLWTAAWDPCHDLITQGSSLNKPSPWWYFLFGPFDTFTVNFAQTIKFKCI